MNRWVNVGAREGICYLVTNGDERFAVVNREYADALAAKLNALEAAPAALNRAALEATVGALIEIVDSWNSAATDEDRGRPNWMLHLTLFDNGGGFIGRRKPTIEYEGVTINQFEDWHEFRNLDELIEVLRREGIEVNK